MTVVTIAQLSKDLQASAQSVIDRAGLIPQSPDQGLSANDLLSCLLQTSIPMAAFLRNNSLYTDDDGLHFDLARFPAIQAVASQIIAEYQAGNRDDLWQKYDLQTDEDADTNGGYILTALATLEILYGPR